MDQNEAVQTQLEDHKEMVKKYKAVFGSEMGKVVLTDLVQRSGFLEIGDLENLKFEAGKRSVMKGILEMVDYDYEYINSQINQVKKTQTRRFGHEGKPELFDT